MNHELLEAVQDLQEQAAELDYLDDLDLEPGADFDNGDVPR